jgi:type VI secretion system protein ImpM
MPGAPQVGFFGKLPSHGDFLRRRAPDPFVAPWDAWLQEAMAESRIALGDEWLDIYLTSPAWRFVADSGACGPDPVAGVLVPSVDRVGRYFPLTVVATLPRNADVVAAALRMDSFFDAVERLAIETLEAPEVELDAFDAALRTASGLTANGSGTASGLDPHAEAVLGDAAVAPVQVGLGAPPRLAEALLKLLSRRLAAVYHPVTLWWTEGSSAIDPSALICSGLPTPEMYTALLDGRWAERGWRTLSAARIDAEHAPEPELDSPVLLMFRSAAASHVGRVRTVNQDAYLARPESGIWVVADGVGGLAAGEIASRLVCDAFADLGAEATFDGLVEAAAERLHQVNGQLVRAALRSASGVRCGSTVVALLLRGDRLAILWAGDSRAYRYRDGRLLQLTRDHSVVESGAGSDVPANVITRAVGGDNVLELDALRDRLRPGDRFLLCSDGLTRMVDEDRLAEWAATASLEEGVDGMIRSSLDAGARDNVTVVLVEASPGQEPGF